jgi:hypothetical protein
VRDGYVMHGFGKVYMEHDPEHSDGRIADTSPLSLPNQPKGDTMSVLRILNSSGDTALEWDVTDPEGIEKIRAEFDNLMSKNMIAFRVDSPTSGEVIKSFDPEAKEIIVSAPLVGG